MTLDPFAELDRPRTVTEAVAGRLRDEIRAGVLEPGARLRQVEVAERFNVSTTPVREAFAALEKEGLLVSSAHRGVIVFRPSSEDLREIYEIRIPLEVLAIEKAVPNIDQAGLEHLSSLLRRWLAPLTIQAATLLSTARSTRGSTLRRVVPSSKS